MKNGLYLLNSDSEADTKIDLTPLIDVVFVVLILFILIAPLVEIDQVELPFSTIEKHGETFYFHQKNALKIHVHKDNTMTLNQVPLCLKELKIQLKALYQADPTASAQIFHDKEAFFGTYQFIKNAVAEAGFKSLDVILEPGPNHASY